MRLPAWAAADHPIVRREATLWRRVFKRWGWAGIPLLLLPCACSAMCALGTLPTMFDPDMPWWGALAFLIWIAVIAIWITGGLWGWILSVIASLGSATLVARERETQNWELLRITVLSVPEIIGAKVTALLRFLLWPIALTLALELAGVGIIVLTAIGLIIAGGIYDPGDFTPGLQLVLGVATLGGAGPVILYLVAALLISLIYNCAIGLLTSTFSRTSGSAVALSFVVHFAINLFIFLPLQQAFSIYVQFLGGVLALVTQQPVLFIILGLLIPFVLPILIEAVIALVAFYLSVSRAQKINE